MDQSSSTDDLQQGVPEVFSPISLDTTLEKEPPSISTDLAAKEYPISPDFQAVEPFSTFTCFGKLPNELRYMIWALTAHHPRTLLLCAERIRNASGHEIFHTHLSLIEHYRSCGPAPSTLHVNQESRRETKKFFHLIFDTIYINPESDTIIPNVDLAHIIPSDLLSILEDDNPYRRHVAAIELLNQLSKVKHFGFFNQTGANSWYTYGRARERRGILSQLPALESVTFILQAFNGAWRSRERAERKLKPSELEAVNSRADLMGRLEQKKLVEAIESDYSLDWEPVHDASWGREAKEKVTTLQKAQLENLGGNIPTVRIYRHTPSRDQV